MYAALPRQKEVMTIFSKSTFWHECILNNNIFLYNKDLNHKTFPKVEKKVKT